MHKLSNSQSAGSSISTEEEFCCRRLSEGNNWGTDLAPVLAEGVGGCAQVVPGDLAVHMVGHVHIDVVAQKLHPVMSQQRLSICHRHSTM